MNLLKVLLVLVLSVLSISYVNSTHLCFEGAVKPSAHNISVKFYTNDFNTLKAEYEGLACKYIGFASVQFDLFDELKVYDSNIVGKVTWNGQMKYMWKKIDETEINYFIGVGKHTIVQWAQKDNGR